MNKFDLLQTQSIFNRVQVVFVSSSSKKFIFRVKFEFGKIDRVQRV